MSVFRIEKTGNYTVMSNHHLKNRNLSLKAKGLISVMLSLPDDWDYSINGLCSITNTGETAITSALKELEDNGYLIRTKVHRDGLYDWDYVVFEAPHQDPGNQPLEDQALEKQVLLSTKQSNTKIQNSPSPSRRQLIQPNKEFQQNKERQDKINKFITDKYNIIQKYDFSETVESRLVDFSRMLAEGGTFLPDMSFESQLQKLKQLISGQQMMAIDNTITRGWKSLDYAIADIQKAGKARFDTAQSSQNQFKPEGQAPTRRSGGETF